MMRFQCPKCQHDIIEEVMTGVIQITSFRDMIGETEEELPEPNYLGPQESIGGTLSHYQCTKCGYKLTLDSQIIHRNDELFKWLQKNGKKVL